MFQKEKQNKGVNNGKKITEALDKADAHPYGAKPFIREDYVRKFKELTDNMLSKKESQRFLKAAQNLKKIKSGHLDKLNVEISSKKIKRNNKKSIF